MKTFKKLTAYVKDAMSAPFLSVTRLH